jgi:UDP-N-acetylmuramyl pentapeptide phosphotransferase/UDP-N-acetylglucosamine-1-phosphate transferase
MTDSFFWFALLLAMLVSSGVAAFIVLTQRWHGRLSLDHDLSGAQKFHEQPVPRIGGMAFMVGLAVAAWFYALENTDSADRLVPVYLLLAGMPAFLAGMVEDITKKVSVKSRLLMTFLSAALAVWLVDASLPRLDTWGIDYFMAFAPIAAVVTCFAVAGMANAVNIIDGFNGLASGSVVIMLLGMAGLAYISNDALLIALCLFGAAAMLGFMVLNFPFGKIFLGDGGAYLAGFWLAECAVLLVLRNPDVSAWAVLLCCIYPIWETLFSIWRKSFYRKTGMGRPDRVHFHMLVYRRLVSQRVGRHAAPWIKHGLTSAFIWVWVIACQVLVASLVGLKMQSAAMILGITAFALIYAMIYRKAVLGGYLKNTDVQIDDEPQVQ